MNISLFTRIAPLAVILLVGCNSTSSRQSTKLVKPLPETTLSQQTEQQRLAEEQARIETCRKALDSLKEVNPKQAAKLSNDFTALLSAATQYNSVRSKVAEPTKQGIDSMYQFKSIKLCADIEKELIDSLVKRGENVQL
uniref:permease n=1 Tax=Klebsiella sp. TaxID=576 RepID=UPI0025830DB5|nr:permease [Klebsiella sp.]